MFPAMQRILLFTLAAAAREDCGTGCFDDGGVSDYMGASGSDSCGA